MTETRSVCGLLFAAAVAASGNASAEISNATMVDFGYKPPGRTELDTVLQSGAYYGNANVLPNLDGTCGGENLTRECIYQNGMVVSTIYDETGPNAHLHQSGTLNDREVAYHNDSGGVYFRTLDSTAFSFDSIEINSPLTSENPYALGGEHSAQDFFEILGFSDAINPDLWAGDGSHYSNLVAYQTVENGFVGTLAMNEAFRNVSSVWIHYFGVPNVSAALFPFKVQVDNIAVSAVQVATVPLPTTIWMFATGMIGLVSVGKRHRYASQIKF